MLVEKGGEEAGDGGGRPQRGSGDTGSKDEGMGDCRQESQHGEGCISEKQTGALMAVS